MTWCEKRKVLRAYAHIVTGCEIRVRWWCRRREAWVESSTTMFGGGAVVSRGRLIPESLVPSRIDRRGRGAVPWGAMVCDALQGHFRFRKDRVVLQGSGKEGA